MTKAVRAFNVIVICLFLLALSLTIGVKLLEKAGMPLPAWLNTESNPAKLEGRALGDSLDVSQYLNLQDIASGNLQDALSQECGDQFPLRDLSLLANGFVQRTLINLANLPTGYATVPAFYGATYAIDSEKRLDVPIAYKIDEDNLTGMRNFLKRINDAKAEFPHVRFVYDQLCDPYASEMNPTYDLQTDMYTKLVYDENIGDLLDETIVQIWDPIESEEEFSTQWFSTEHHWKIERALRSYNKIAEQLGLKHVDYDDSIKITEEWYGTNATHALFLGYHDELWDLPISFDSLNTYVNGEPADYGKREDILAGNREYSEYGGYGFYNVYYGDNSAEVIYDNSGNNNGKNCLVLSQSYSNPINPYIASNYNQTVVLDIVNRGLSKPLDYYLSEFDIDDCIIQVGMVAYSLIDENSTDSI